MDKKNLCVIGYGAMGKWHADAAKVSDVVNLVGVCDISEAARKAAEADGIFTYDSFDDVLKDEKVDIITIVTRNDTHKEYTIKALKAGKHVICEKPAALSSKDLQEMIAASEACGRIFTVHQNRRWNVDFLAMKQLAESGELGKIFNVESRIHGSRGIPCGWRSKREFGGGMLWDWGVHLIDQMVKIIPGKIVGISCDFDYITVDEVDDGFRLNLIFESGSRAYIEVGTYNLISMPRFYMRAEKGSAMIEEWRKPCEVIKLKAWTEEEADKSFKSDKPVMTMAPRDELTAEKYTIDIPKSDVHDFYRNVCAAIVGKEEQYITHSDMMRVIKVIETAFESENKGVIKCNI